MIPTQVISSIGTRQVTLRRFRFPYFEAFCNNCIWVSFTYATEDEAADRAESHAERCCKRLNEMRALQVEVNPVEAQNLEHGDSILLRDLRTMTVDNVDTFGDEVIITYNIDGLEGELLWLPVGHIVKVVVHGKDS